MKRRQMAFYEYGKNSHVFKYCRNKVQYVVKQARKTYYSHSVDKLKTQIQLDGGKKLNLSVLYRHK